jgi:hypothetical protein
MLTGLACLCRPCHLAGPAHAAATARFSTQEGEIPRETDCLLEGDGFELSVPRQTGNSFRASSELGPIDRRRGGGIRAVAGLGNRSNVGGHSKELLLTTESGDTARTALSAGRAHRGTGSSNPSPSTGESVSSPRITGEPAAFASGVPSVTRMRTGSPCVKSRRFVTSGLIGDY